MGLEDGDNVSVASLHPPGDRVVLPVLVQRAAFAGHVAVASGTKKRTKATAEVARIPPWCWGAMLPLWSHLKSPTAVVFQTFLVRVSKVHGRKVTGLRTDSS